MTEKFLKSGYEIVDFSQSADVYVVNSCSVTNLSTRKTRQILSRARHAGGIVVLCGCYAEEIKDKYTQLKNVDVIIGNEQKNEIVDIVKKYIELTPKKKTKNNVIVEVGDISKAAKYTGNDTLEKGINIRESVKIEDGCNNFCSYCIIPYVRGRVRSRNIDTIVQEVKNLVASGVGEVVLVGIEIASYGKDLDNSLTLVDVIEKVSQVEGLKRIRLGSIEPRFLTLENIIRMSKIEKLCPHFHISVQSLDNGVLRRMNRKYTREDIFTITDNLKKYFKNVAFTCDIIVGFPGESDEEFENTLDGVKRVGFYEVHVFKYSKRKWTRAASMENQVDGNVAIERSKRLISIANEKKLEYMQNFIGKKMDVLFESYKDGNLYGFTRNYIKVKVKGDEKLWGLEEEIVLDSIEDELILGSI